MKLTEHLIGCNNQCKSACCGSHALRFARHAARRLPVKGWWGYGRCAALCCAVPAEHAGRPPPSHTQVVKALAEAEAHPGPSLVVAYAPCAMHGVAGGMSEAGRDAKMAVDCGYWPLWRYQPTGDLRSEAGRLMLDSKRLRGDLETFLGEENRCVALLHAFSSFVWVWVVGGGRSQAAAGRPGGVPRGREQVCAAVFPSDSYSISFYFGGDGAYAPGAGLQNSCGATWRRAWRRRTGVVVVFSGWGGMGWEGVWTGCQLQREAALPSLLVPRFVQLARKDARLRKIKGHSPPAPHPTCTKHRLTLLAPPPHT